MRRKLQKRVEISAGASKALPVVRSIFRGDNLLLNDQSPGCLMNRFWAGDLACFVKAFIPQLVGILRGANVRADVGQHALFAALIRKHSSTKLHEQVAGAWLGV